YQPEFGRCPKGPERTGRDIRKAGAQAMRRLCLFIAPLIALASGCGARRRPSNLPILETPQAAATVQRLNLTDVAKQAGIDFRLGHGNRTPLTILETAGGGCAFLDYDTDGWPDILLVGPFSLGLYHNLHNGKFQDVTA